MFRHQVDEYVRGVSERESGSVMTDDVGLGVLGLTTAARLGSLAALLEDIIYVVLGELVHSSRHL